MAKFKFADYHKSRIDNASSLNQGLAQFRKVCVVLYSNWSTLLHSRNTNRRFCYGLIIRLKPLYSKVAFRQSHVSKESRARVRGPGCQWVEWVQA